MNEVTTPSAPTPSPPTPGRYTAGTWLTQREAAEACGCSVDSIQRARRAGRFKNAVQRDRHNLGEGNVWWIPVTDLVGAGKLDPSQVSAAVELLTATREIRETSDLKAIVAELRATVTGLQQQVLDTQALAQLHEQHAAALAVDKAAAGAGHQRDVEMLHGLVTDLRADLAAVRAATAVISTNAPRAVA